MSIVADSAVACRPHDYRSSAQPIWCPGCGDYGVLNCLMEAFSIVGRPPHEIAIVSGIGCSSRLPAYTKCYGFHGVHGRALPFSVGLKMVRPDLEVVAVGGDGTDIRLAAIISCMPAAETSTCSTSSW